MCVCVRERESVCVCERERESMYVCACDRERAGVCVIVNVCCVCVKGRVIAFV